MNEFSLPIKTNFLVKADKLKRRIQAFKVVAEKQLNKDITYELYLRLQRDGSSIVTTLLGYNDINKNRFEFSLGFLWFLEFYNKEDISSIDIISNWEIIPEQDQSTLLSYMISSTHELNYLESLVYLNSTLSKTDDYNNIKSEIVFLLKDFFVEVARIDNNLSEHENLMFAELNKLLHLDYSQFNYSNLEGKIKERNIDTYSQDLNSLVGLSDIKNEVASLISFVKINQLRKSKGLPDVTISLHSVFFGPPGTGKTTIARILAKAYKDLGLLISGHLVETDRSQLVAAYVGQTAIKTREVLDKALNGILFIDEAYSLNSNDDFGKEAIDTILKYMEDNRDKIIIIVAGYENEMSGFINSNPGLKSRFNKYFFFKNYSAPELSEIFINLLNKNKFSITDDGLSKVNLIIEDAIKQEASQFGNARFIRNLYEKIIQNQFLRISQLDNIDEKVLSEIICNDIPG